MKAVGRFHEKQNLANAVVSNLYYLDRKTDTQHLYYFEVKISPIYLLRYG